MSIHAQLSEEALQALQRQKRTSTITSIVIAALTIVLIGLILGLFLLDAFVRETPTIITYSATLDEEQSLDDRKVTTQLQRQPASPSSAQAKVIAANTASPTAIPVPDIEISTPAADFGDTDDFGTGFGDETARTGGFSGIPSTMRRRCSPEDRLARLRETGGTPECEDAVERGLEWLQTTQNANGSWGQNQYVPAYTAFGLLCYLGRCETPTSVKYGANVLRAITYLVDVGMKNEGRLTNNTADNQWSYEHAIAVYALAEAYTFCKQLDVNIPNLEEVTRKAGQFLIDNQNRNGGWAYQYTTQGGHVDTSVTGWQLQALKAMEYTGIEYEGLVRAANRGVDYMESVQGSHGGFGYQSANSPAGGGGYFTMTGGGVLTLQLWGKGSSAAVRRGAKYIEDNSKFVYDERYSDLLGLYYESQAMLNRGGEQWRKYNTMFRDELLSGQNTDGSWKRPASKAQGGIRAVGARFVDSTHYRTCLAILTLENYYRFLPGTGGAR